MHLPIQTLRALLPAPASERYPKGTPFVLGLQQGELSIELFQPAAAGIGRDIQQPHRQDELYVALQGHARFEHRGKTIDVHIGDILQVPAGEPHRFVDFSDDFQVWVIFYGPATGEVTG